MVIAADPDESAGRECCVAPLTVKANAACESAHPTATGLQRHFGAPVAREIPMTTARLRLPIPISPWDAVHAGARHDKARLTAAHHQPPLEVFGLGGRVDPVPPRRSAAPPDYVPRRC